jgi:hypothetical protein
MTMMVAHLSSPIFIQCFTGSKRYNATWPLDLLVSLVHKCGQHTVNDNPHFVNEMFLLGSGLQFNWLE